MDTFVRAFVIFSQFSTLMRRVPRGYRCLKQEHKTLALGTVTTGFAPSRERQRVDRAMQPSFTVHAVPDQFQRPNRSGDVCPISSDRRITERGRSQECR